ncbi:hypothetical protein KDA_20660 [Dictyobacter alpinus]|uniref:FtsK domain-containing protein n=1 Tax=Dictyobacter alpinus TaxID=2014873 RepID=A0A402B5F6_9CHLR|nr:FtsK/SpoIIIE domain-containing protein [Dictyobacter alpinus]GCE26582.1 hypothetical protein KDA_20660 [Dictyobacter alpinus]
MSKQPLSTITRKARIWPEISKAGVELPNPPGHQNNANPLTLITMLCSMAGMFAYIVIMPRFGGNSFFIVGIFIMSSCVMIGALLNFLFQWIPARRQKRRLQHSYTQKITSVKKQLRLLSLQERQGRLELDPPLIIPTPVPEHIYQQLTYTPILQRSFNNQDIQLWSRKPDDPDFLAVRIGMGERPPTFQIKRVSAPSTGTTTSIQARQWNELETLAHDYTSLIVPISISLAEQGTMAILDVDTEPSQARQQAMLMVANLAYHHSPDDVRIMILAPESQREVWEWAEELPHTQLYDPRLTSEEIDNTQQEHAVAIGNEAVLNLLPLISREVSRRELLLGDIQPHLQDKARAILPRLIIVVDHFDPVKDLNQPPSFLPLARIPSRPTASGTIHRSRLTSAPLQRPEMTLALNAARALGVSVITICSEHSAMPPNTSILLELRNTVDQQQETASVQAQIRYLAADAPPAIQCQWLDQGSQEAFHYLARKLQPLRPTTPKRLELRIQVDLCSLFEPHLDLAKYDPSLYWQDPALRLPDGTPTLRLPIGLKMADEIQYLDLLKDGPHGLLIGQTGSGKSELLQTIISALAIAYPPAEVNFLLIDYKAGLALEPFSHLPHTIGFLSNVSSEALIQRFILMLKAEATRREIRLREGRATPRLIIIIDEFAEMVKRTDSVLEELFTITRVGREIGMHLLLAAQRPEGIIGSKLRDYVQYRLCLRCASPEDSREVLRRIDAATLPASIPGRGYLLHGDNQLDLFQAARISMPTTPFVQNLYTTNKQKSIQLTNKQKSIQLTNKQKSVQFTNQE